MNELPDLPFELVLSYLGLEDRLRSRAVSRTWKLKIDQFRVKSLCCSDRPSGFIEGKSRNFISSTRFISFFNTFGRSILSNLKHLRLFDLEIKEENRSDFIEILQSFGQLEELVMVRLNFQYSNSRLKLELSLPMIRSIHIERLSGIDQLTLNTPRLQEMKLDDSLILDLVHVESVERVAIGWFNQTRVKDLKNLKQLYVRYRFSLIDPTFLSSLEQLREMYLDCRDPVPAIFEQKRRYGRTDLKVYLYGLLLSGPEDPVSGFNRHSKEMFFHLVENAWKLGNEIPFYEIFYYSTIESVDPQESINVLSRLTDLRAIIVDRPVQDIERFLKLLKNFDNIVELAFWSDQPQELFDRLPEHCAVQKLTIYCLPPDHQFLFQLKNLIKLNTMTCLIVVECIRKILEELEFISSLECCTRNNHPYLFLRYTIAIHIVQKQFRVSVDGSAAMSLPDRNAAIEFIKDKIKFKKNI